MQMAKRVSLSQPNTFYRGSIEIEPLGSHYSPTRVDRTCRSKQSDARHPVSGHGIAATCHTDSTVIVDHQRSTEFLARVNEGPDALIH